MKRTFTYIDEKSIKFWTIETNGDELAVACGNAGTAGQTAVKTFDTDEKCLKEAEKLIAEKTKKGYVEEKGSAISTVDTENKSAAIKRPTNIPENTKPRYYILDAVKTRKNCILCYENGSVRRKHTLLNEGVTYTPDEPIELHMWEKWKGTLIPDYVCTTESGHVVSDRVKSIMQEHVVGKIEFLPCVIYNHEKRKVTSVGEYWIANIIGVCDCLDRERSDGSKSGYKVPEYDCLGCVVLDTEKIPSELNLFRLASLPCVFIIRNDLRALFEKEKIKNIVYIEQGKRCLL